MIQKANELSQMAWTSIITNFIVLFIGLLPNCAPLKAQSSWDKLHFQTHCRKKAIEVLYKLLCAENICAFTEKQRQIMFNIFLKVKQNNNKCASNCCVM